MAMSLQKAGMLLPVKRMQKCTRCNKQAPAASGATAYVTLEPCSHHGKTGPCCDALIQAGIARVVYGMQDPNPQVSGNGLQKLRDAGITVDGPLLEKHKHRN
jgi:pyrimidine deaminase RibD-like protein